MAHGRMVGVIGLDDDVTRMDASSRASRDLRQKLKRPFAGTEVGQTEERVDHIPLPEKKPRGNGGI